MKDEAGNLNFTHNDTDYRIRNFGWRAQRETMTKLFPAQTEEGANALFSESGIEAQNYLFSLTQYREGEKYTYLSPDEQDRHFDSYQDAIALYNAIMEAILPFLVNGEAEKPRQKPESAEKTSPTAPKRKTTLKQ